MSGAAKVVSRHHLQLIPIIFFLFFSLSYLLEFPQKSITQEVEASFTTQPMEFLPYKENLSTESKFNYKIIEKRVIIPFETQFVDDPTADTGTFQVTQEGRTGAEVKTIKTTYYQDNEYEQEVISIEKQEPQPKIIKKGTKPNMGKLTTPQGEIVYKAKMRVWATSYDKNCQGCNETTATGMKTGYGVIAVDPNIIPLGSKVYIPGYGLAVAGDVGGGVKGAVVDLGFDDVKKGWWSARFTDLYILQ